MGRDNLVAVDRLFPPVVNAVTFIEGGRSAYRIVLPVEPQPAESYAAEELQRYLSRMSGVELPIGSDEEPAGKKEIWLGDTSRLRQVLAGRPLKPPLVVAPVRQRWLRVAHAG